MLYLLLWTMTVAVFVSSFSSATSAARPEEKDAVRRFNLASDLAAEGKVEQAVGIWLEIHEKLPQRYRGRLHYALGVSYAALGRIAEAWHHLRAYVVSEERPATAVLEEFQRVEAMTSGYVSVSLVCQPDGAGVTLDPTGDGVFYPCPLIWWFKAGRQVVRAEGGGRIAEERVIEVPTHVDAIEEVITLRSSEPPAQRRIWQWALLGSGLSVALAGGAVHLWGYVHNETLHDRYSDLPKAEYEQEYRPRYRDEVKPKLTSAYVLYGVGGTAAVTSMVFLLLDSESRPETRKVRLVPFLDWSGSGFAIELLF